MGRLLQKALVALLVVLPMAAQGHYLGRGYVENRYQERVASGQGLERPGHRAEALFEGRAWYQDWALDGVALGRYRTQYDDVGGRLEDEMAYDLDLRELYLTWSGMQWEARIGRQQQAWGRADYFRIVDVVNPLDLREFLLPYIENYSLGRVPRDMAILEYYGNEWEHQWLAAYGATRTEFAPAGADFALAGMPEERVPLNEPDNPIDVGWRAKRFWSGSDVEFYGFSGLHPDPLFVVREGELERTQRRQTMLGASIARPMGDWVVRGDLAHFPRTPLQTEGGYEYVERSSALIGLDRMQNQWTWNLQLTASHWHDRPQGTVKPTTWEASAAVERDWSRHRLTGGLLWLYNREEAGSHLFRANLVYRPWQQWRTEAGVLVFEGGDETFFGQFDRQDRVYISIRREFGF